MLVCVSFSHFAHGTAGAARIRHSPRPLISRRETFWQTSGEPRRENAKLRLSLAGGEFVGWAKAPLRRAHHVIKAKVVGTLRFAHPTRSAQARRTGYPACAGMTTVYGARQCAHQLHSRRLP